MELLKAQLWKAVRTLPWYVGIPFVLVGSVLLAVSLLITQPAGYDYHNEILIAKVAAGFGFVLWVFRQAVRLLWTARILQTTSAEEIRLRR